jgi:hypothetical protein
MDKFVVRKRNLKYRVTGVREGKSFTPAVGEVILLPDEVAETEINSGNVRRLLPEEKTKEPRVKKKKKRIVKKRVKSE